MTSSATMGTMVDALEIAFAGLRDAMIELRNAHARAAPSVATLTPPAPMSLGRGLTAAIEIGTWGYEYNLLVRRDEYSRVTETASSRERASYVANKLGFQPRRVLRAVRRVETLTTWCRARIGGIERASAELLRQQAGAAQTLEAMVALEQLAKSGGTT